MTTGFIMQTLIYVISMVFLPLRRRRSSAGNVPSGEERGETAVFASCMESRIQDYLGLPFNWRNRIELKCEYRWLPQNRQIVPVLCQKIEGTRISERFCGNHALRRNLFRIPMLIQPFRNAYWPLTGPSKVCRYCSYIVPTLYEDIRTILRKPSFKTQLV